MANMEKSIDKMFNHGDGLFSTSGMMAPTDYIPYVTETVKSLGLKAIAMEKLGLTESDVLQDGLVFLHGFNANAEMGWAYKVSGTLISPLVELTYLFFTASGVHLYTYKFSTIDPKYKKESTDHFEYSEIENMEIVAYTVKRVYGTKKTPRTEVVTFTKLALSARGHRVFYTCTNDPKTVDRVEKAKQILAARKG